MPRLKPHLLRHTFATSYILGGGDISSLRLILGHSDIKVTEKYLHISNTLYLSAGRNNIYKLDKVFFLGDITILLTPKKNYFLVIVIEPLTPNLQIYT